MAHTPETVAPGLAERLTLISATEPVDEVALRRFVADANKLMGADAATGHQLLGRVAALRWDIDEMKRRHRLSVSLGDPVLSRCNFAHSLSIVGRFDEAFEMALEASEHTPNDLIALNVLLVNAALANGRLRDAQRFANRWRNCRRAMRRLLFETLTRPWRPWTKACVLAQIHLALAEP